MLCPSWPSVEDDPASHGDEGRAGGSALLKVGGGAGGVTPYGDRGNDSGGSGVNGGGGVAYGDGRGAGGTGAL